MPKCTVCNHSRAHDINLALLAGAILDHLKFRKAVPVGPKEALYLNNNYPYANYNNLSLPVGDTTLNLNGLHLYVQYVQDNHQNIYLVKSGEGNLFGGSQIINRILNPKMRPAIDLLLNK